MVMAETPKPLLLHDAARRGDVSTLKDLLEQHADPKERHPETGNTALHEAALAGQTSCVEVLLPYSIPHMVNQQKLTALCLAAAAGDLQTVKVFFKEKKKRNSLGLVSRAMRFASTSDVMVFLSTLIPDIVEMRKGGRMALVAAAEDGRTEAVKTLLHLGVEPRKSKKNGKTAVMYAAENGRLECLRLLLDHGIDIVQTDWLGHTVLHKAVLSGNSECVELLLARGANIHAREINKMTPLHMAAKHNHIQCVETLLRHGADRTRVDKSKQTPLDYAKCYNFKEVIDLLDI